MKALLILILCTTVLLTGCAITTVAKQPNPQSYVKSHPQLSNKFKQAILSNKLIIGMSKDDVIAVMGEPYDWDKHITITQWGRSEQWAYYGYSGTIPKYFIYFDNDKLSSIQKY